MEGLNWEGKKRNGWGHVLDETTTQIPVYQVESRDGSVKMINPLLKSSVDA